MTFSSTLSSCLILFVQTGKCFLERCPLELSLLETFPSQEAVEKGTGCRADRTQECFGPRVLMCIHPASRLREESDGEAPEALFCFGI